MKIEATLNVKLVCRLVWIPNSVTANFCKGLDHVFGKKSNKLMRINVTDKSLRLFEDYPKFLV